MFRTRLISGIVLVALALFFLVQGGGLLLLVSLFLSLVGLFELYRVFRIEKTAFSYLGYLMTVCYYANLRFSLISDAWIFVIVFWTLLAFAYVFSYPKYEAKDLLGAFFGFFYVSVMLSFLYQTRMLEGGRYLVWLIFLCSWGSDTCAYCVGVLFGKHKMTPKLSPKKSWEGFFGGLVGASLLTLLYAFIFQAQLGIEGREFVFVALIGCVGAMISVVGDLVASAIKRNYEIKDYGKLIPGHGGVLDRFDSVIFTAPIIYYLACYFLA